VYTVVELNVWALIVLRSNAVRAATLKEVFRMLLSRG